MVDNGVDTAGGNYEQPANYPVDTTSDDNLWVVLRRVHFFAGDLITSGLSAIDVNTSERRILDALDDAESRGHASVSTATLCVIVIPSPKPSTALSTLRRMRARGWVESTGDNNGQHWSLAPGGRETRRLYGQIAEQIQEQIYAEANKIVRPHLNRFGHRALTFMDERVVPILDGVAVTEAQPRPRTTWAALRRVHFHLSDRIAQETASMDVGMNERRVLDALGLTRKKAIEYGVEMPGLSVATFCRLNPALTRQIVLSTLEKAEARHWVAKTRPTSPRGWLWDLTPKGVKIRETYKRYAQHKLREVYELNNDDQLLFRQLTLSAQAYRNARLEPIVRKALLPTTTME